MNRIISGISNPPSDDFFQKKQLLNKEFFEKSQIKGLVSCIYYPYIGHPAVCGHTELEIEGRSYTLMIPSRLKSKRLAKMINSTVHGDGYPFFRFPISVTLKQLQDINNEGLETFGPLCSMGVGKCLSRQGKINILLPFSFSPVLLTICLISKKIFGSERIGQIEVYTGKRVLKHSLFSVVAVCCEFFLIYSVLSLCVQIPCTKSMPK